jgi:hypothetical protein
MRILSSLSRRRRVLVAITASLIVHLLVISTYERWATDEVTQVLLPVRMDPAPTMAEPDRFRSSAPRRLPRAARERLRRETALPPLSTPLPSADEPPLPDLPELTIRTDDVLKARGKGSLPTAAALDLHEQMMEAFRRKKAQPDRRSLYALPDADTTDQDDRGHGLAEAIIDSAIAAMGGLERLQAVTDKTVQVWFYDSEKQEWERTEKRYFWRGLRFREDIRRAIARGFDGQRSWYSRFGVNLPAPDLSGKAERWDFLSRYKGDGILLEYVGLSGRTRPEQVIRVTDVTHGGRQWEAFFDQQSHLLVAIKEGKVLTEYTEYREAGGILLPYELWVQRGRFLSVYRHEIQLNSGLELTLFVAPKARTWSRESVRMIVLEHVGEDRVDGTLSLKIRPIWQKRSPPGREVDPLSLNLLNTYFLEEFKAAGIAAEGEEVRWLETVIERYFVGSNHQLIFTVTLRDMSDRGWVWSEKMEYVWRPLKGAIAINDEAGLR